MHVCYLKFVCYVNSAITQILFAFILSVISIEVLNVKLVLLLKTLAQIFVDQ